MPLPIGILFCVCLALSLAGVYRLMKPVRSSDEAARNFIQGILLILVPSSYISGMLFGWLVR